MGKRLSFRATKMYRFEDRENKKERSKPCFQTFDRVKAFSAWLVLSITLKQIVSK